MQSKHVQVKQYFRKNLYKHKSVREMATKPKHIVRTLYETFVLKPGQIMDISSIADSTKRNVNTADSIECIIKDHIAGMTERYAILEYERIIKVRHHMK
ncbi:MAG: dGTPase [Planctomycetota bacterium]|jgi:dGTPase